MQNGYRKYSFWFLLSAIIFLAGFSIFSNVQAATGINEQINFQGKVVNTDGTNVSTASYTFLFCLYTTASPATPCTAGADNDAVWRESKSLTVTDGIFQTNLGDTTTLPGSVDFNTDSIYLGINFNANGQMSPLVRFTAAPYALNAAKVGGLTVTDTTGTLTIPSGKTISFADAFATSGAFATTLTATGTTNVTLPTTGTLATLAGSEQLTNKTIGSTGLTFSGATTDITTASGESLVIVANGVGTVDIQDATTVDSLTADTGGITISAGALAVNSDSITSDGTLVINASGTVDIDDILNANSITSDAGVSIAAGQSYTGAGAVTVSSAAATALTLDSGTTGAINIGTGTAGKAISIGTDNTASDTINIGSALDNVAITGDQWSISDAGVLTVVSCTGCGGGSQTPWSSDISAAGYDLGSLSNLLFQETTGAPIGTDVGFYRDNTGDLTGNVLTGKTFNLAVNGTDEYNFSSTTLAMNSNTITNAASYNGLVITANTGVITTGTWNGTDIAVADGGTGTSTGSITGTTALTFAAGGTAQNVNLTPSTTGAVTIASSTATTDILKLQPKAGAASFAGIITTADLTVSDKTYTFPDASITVNAAADISGTTLASNVITSSLTTVGTLGSLTVTGAITANGGVSLGAQTLTGTTGIINYTGFDVDASGNLDALGTITAGSGNVAVTDAAGKVQHDSIVDCTDTQILKWATAGGWACATDATGGGGGIATIQENDVDAVTSAATIDFLGTDFIIGAVGSEGNISIDYTNSGITRKGQAETVTGGWTFNTAATAFTTAINANGGISIGTQALTGSTGNIDYTNFDMTGSSGNVDIGGTITVGSGNEIITLSTGKIDADALTLAAAADGGTGTSSGSGLMARSDGIGLLQGCTDGQVLKWVESTDTWDCSTISGGSANSGLESVQVFTTANDGADAYNESIASVTHLVVELVGGGGAGGAGSTGDASGGGGAGGYSSEIIESYSANESVVVGAGGTGTTGTGNAGGTTSFGDATADLQATGGGGGVLDGNGGAGGVGSNGDINLTGANGGRGSGTAANSVPDGGGSFFGGGGNGAAAVTGCGNGAAPGAGGGGNAVSGNGCAGANGIVIVWEYSGTAGSDYAEYYETDGSATAGDLVGMGSEMFEYTTEDGVQRMAVLEKATPDNRLIGVVSTAPGMLIGKEIREAAKNPRPIALTGRVPTKVSNMNGQIKKGDLLTASAIPGVAMKSSKAGQVIGSAMEDYNGTEGEIGKITVFVNTGYSTGARTKDLLAKQGVQLEENVLEIGTDVDKILLAQLLAQKNDIRADVPVSEIFTDRVVAGLGIVTPKVTTQELLTDIIKPSLTNQLSIKLGPDGEVTIGESDREPTSRIDAFGNATFSGTVTAKSIKAESIEGLEIFTDQISSLADKYAGLVSLAAVTEVTGISEEESVSAPSLPADAAFEDVAADTLDVSLDADVLGKLTVDGGLVIGNKAEFNGDTFFRKLASFFGEVVFKGSVAFKKIPTFESDTAGYAVIGEGQDRVAVAFEEEYAFPPVVNASLSLRQIENAEVRDAAEELLLVSDVKFIITHVTTKGFEIRINEKALSGISFSWQALAVKGVKTFTSESISVLTPEVPQESVVAAPEDPVPDPALLPAETVPVEPADDPGTIPSVMPGTADLLTPDGVSAVSDPVVGSVMNENIE